jgi:riboflavin synthase
MENMFTGLIAGEGIIAGITRRGVDAVLACTTDLDLSDIKVGDSIAVNGACLTVVTKGGRSFTADVSAETLARTNLGTLRPGSAVNLEKSLRPIDFLGGHIVLGHVDGLGIIRSLVPRSQSLVFGIEVEEDLGRYIVVKGSIAVDGISLTVNSYEKDRFYVNIVPHTARKTTLDSRKVGDTVNVETDILGKYVERLLTARKTGGGLDMDFLAKHGFLRR